ncbi:alpha/beta hydrolase [Candidatus Neomarinimicrobiota bacterium]
MRYFFLIISLTGSIYSQGRLIEDQFISNSLAFERNVNVYLPAMYDSNNTNIEYPVVYFLHGGGGDHNSYSGIIPILDSLIANNIIKPMIFVKPDGSCEPYLGSQYSNSELYGAFEDYITF